MEQDRPAQDGKAYNVPVISLGLLLHVGLQLLLIGILGGILIASAGN